MSVDRRQQARTAAVLLDTAAVSGTEALILDEALHELRDQHLSEAQWLELVTALVDLFRLAITNALLVHESFPISTTEERDAVRRALVSVSLGARLDWLDEHGL